MSMHIDHSLLLLIRDDTTNSVHVHATPGVIYIPAGYILACMEEMATLIEYQLQSKQ